MTSFICDMSGLRARALFEISYIRLDDRRSIVGASKHRIAALGVRSRSCDVVVLSGIALAKDLVKR